MNLPSSSNMERVARLSDSFLPFLVCHFMFINFHGRHLRKALELLRMKDAEECGEKFNGRQKMSIILRAC